MARLFQRHDLRMIQTRPCMETSPNDLLVADNQRSDRRVWARLSSAAPCQLKRFRHVVGHVGRYRRSVEQRCHELVGLEWQQVVDLFSDPYKPDREVQLTGNRNHHASFRRTVQLGKDDARHAR